MAEDESYILKNELESSMKKDEKFEFSLKLVNIYIRSGNVEEASKYLEVIDSLYEEEGLPYDKNLEFIYTKGCFLIEFELATSEKLKTFVSETLEACCKISKTDRNHHQIIIMKLKICFLCFEFYLKIGNLAKCKDILSFEVRIPKVTAENKLLEQYEKITAMFHLKYGQYYLKKIQLSNEKFDANDDERKNFYIDKTLDHLLEAQRRFENLEQFHFKTLADYYLGEMKFYDCQYDEALILLEKTRRHFEFTERYGSKLGYNLILLSKVQLEQFLSCSNKSFLEKARGYLSKDVVEMSSGVTKFPSMSKHIPFQSELEKMSSIISHVERNYRRLYLNLKSLKSFSNNNNNNNDKISEKQQQATFDINEKKIDPKAKLKILLECFSLSKDIGTILTSFNVLLDILHILTTTKTPIKIIKTCSHNPPTSSKTFSSSSLFEPVVSFDVMMMPSSASNDPVILNGSYRRTYINELCGVTLSLLQRNRSFEKQTRKGNHLPQVVKFLIDEVKLAMLSSSSSPPSSSATQHLKKEKVVFDHYFDIFQDQHPNYVSKFVSKLRKQLPNLLFEKEDNVFLTMLDRSATNADIADVQILDSDNSCCSDVLEEIAVMGADGNGIGEEVIVVGNKAKEHLPPDQHQAASDIVSLSKSKLKKKFLELLQNPNQHALERDAILKKLEQAMNFAASSSSTSGNDKSSEHEQIWKKRKY